MGVMCPRCRRAADHVWLQKKYIRLRYTYCCCIINIVHLPLTIHTQNCTSSGSSRRRRSVGDNQGTTVSDTATITSGPITTRSDNGENAHGPSCVVLNYACHISLSWSLTMMTSFRRLHAGIWRYVYTVDMVPFLVMFDPPKQKTRTLDMNWSTDHPHVAGVFGMNLSKMKPNPEKESSPVKGIELKLKWIEDVFIPNKYRKKNKEKTTRENNATSGQT